MLSLKIAAWVRLTLGLSACQGNRLQGSVALDYASHVASAASAPAGSSLM